MISKGLSLLASPKGTLKMHVPMCMLCVYIFNYHYPFYLLESTDVDNKDKENPNAETGKIVLLIRSGMVLSVFVPEICHWSEFFNINPQALV